MADSWTDDRVAELRRLWEAGWSCSQIAAELGGVTRNAVIGKVHRLELQARKTVRVVARVPKAPKPPRARTPRYAYSVLPEGVEPVRVELREADIEPLHIDLDALNSSNCHWPYGDGPVFTFCGCRALKDKPYCYAHDRIGHGNGTASERSAVKVKVAA